MTTRPGWWRGKPKPKFVSVPAEELERLRAIERWFEDYADHPQECILGRMSAMFRKDPKCECGLDELQKAQNLKTDARNGAVGAPETVSQQNAMKDKP